MRKKIGLLIPNLQSGGAERVISIISRLLSEEEYEVYIILYDSKFISYEYSGKLISLNSFKSNNLVMKVVNRIIRIIKLSFYKKKYNLDVVISFLYAANIVNFFSMGKAKKIISIRGYSDYKKNKNQYFKIIPKIHSTIVQTQRLRDELVKNSIIDKEKISVLPNPFDIEEIQKLSNEKIENNILNFINNHETICSVGSFKKDKGYWHLIKAFEEVKKHKPNVGLLLIGHNGNLEKEIYNMVMESKHKKDILFLGYQDNPFKYISKTQLYICSSINEGFPNSIVEALACGVPVISTDCKTGPREILSKEKGKSECKKIEFVDYGVLIPKLSPLVNFNLNKIEEEERIMARAIIIILENKQLHKYYSERSLIRATKFSDFSFLKKLVQIIK